MLERAGHDFTFTEGPVPSTGGTVSSLQAVARDAVARQQSSTVSVLDETPAGGQSVLLSCTVSARATTCSNSGPASIAAGHYLMVRISTTSAPTSWRVSFRF